MKKLVFATIIIITGYILLGAFTAKADELLRTQAVNPVYKIFTDGAVCSATAIKLKGAESVNTFLTAKHCINPEHPVGKLLEESITENSESTKVYDYKVVVVSKSSDLAGIVVTSEDFHPQKAVIADTQTAQEGDEVFSVGYPLGASRTVTVGLLGQKERGVQPSGELKVMQRASTQIDKGMSGGPLYQKTEKGYEIIGVASTKVGANNFMNSFVTLTDIKNFIENGN